MEKTRKNFTPRCPFTGFIYKEKDTGYTKVKMPTCIGPTCMMWIDEENKCSIRAAASNIIRSSGVTEGPINWQGNVSWDEGLLEFECKNCERKFLKRKDDEEVERHDVLKMFIYEGECPYCDFVGGHLLTD